MKKGYITEIFSSFQGEGPYTGRRQLFIRFAGCPLSCFYCDTSYARDPRPNLCNVLLPGKKTHFKRNPLSTSEVMDYLTELLTPDVHSICYTGGEPLSSVAFVKEIAAEAKMMQFKNFIETSGNSARDFASLADHFDFASIDIKLRNHGAVEEKDYDDLYSNELECIRIAVGREIETIVKVIVVKNTPVGEIEGICKDLAGLDVLFVLQPVTAPAQPGIKELFELSEVAGLYLHHVMVIPQVHTFWGIH